MSNTLTKYSDLSDDLNKLSGAIVDCAFQVHQTLGPGFLEVNYEDAMVYELETRSIPFERQKAFSIPYKDTILKSDFRFDLLVGGQILVELKSVEKIHPIHQAQIYAYLRATQFPIGLLINFNVPLIKDGIGRYTLRSSASPR